MNARFLALALVAVVVGACGSPDDGGPGGGDAAPAATSPADDFESPVSSTPVDDPDSPVASTSGIPGTGGRAQVVEPRPGMTGVRARPFTKAVPVDDKTIKVLFFSGIEPCTVLDRVEVEETEESVTITLYEGHDPDGGDQACIEIAVKKAVLVELESPVGDRKILDGAA